MSSWRTDATAGSRQCNEKSKCSSAKLNWYHNWEWYEVYEVTMELKTELRALKVKCDVV